jgi:hypothetical protein
VIIEGLMSKERNRREAAPTAEPATKPAAAPPSSEETLGRATTELLYDQAELLRRTRSVIQYIWGTEPPFKDLADVLANISSALLDLERVLEPDAEASPDGGGPFR